MKTNNSFSSLPTSAHLHSEVVCGGRFVFNNALKNQEITPEVVSKSLSSVQTELIIARTKVEKGNLNQEVVDKQREVGKEKWVHEEADRLRSDRELAAQKMLKEKFENLSSSFDQILEKTCGAVASSEGMSAQDWLKKQILEIKTLPDGEVKNQKIAILQPFIKALKEEGKAAVTKEGFGKKWLYGSQNIETRIGNGFGAGLMTLYIAGLIWGGEKNTMWYGGLLIGGAAAALPSATAKVFNAADWVLDNVVGRPINFTFTKVKNVLVGAARLDTGQMWDGETAINEERDKYLAAFYQGGVLKPGKDENGEVLVDGEMHSRILNPLKGKEFTPQQCDQAARFCASMIDPKIFLEGKDFPRKQLQNIRRGGEWGSETMQLMQRRFATQETMLIWNYFMLHADKEKELGHFAKSFAAAFKERQEHPLTQAEAAKKLQAMYPDLTARLMHKTPEGFASFMKEGGLEDIFVALALFMGAVYVGVGAVAGIRKAAEKIKEYKNKNPKEKYDEKRKEAKNDFVKLITKTNAHKSWKKILTALGGMSILSIKEQKKLKGLTTKEKKDVITAIVKAEKAEKFELGGELKSIKESQNVFWGCVKTAGVGLSGKRGIEMGKPVDTKEKEAETKLKSLQTIKERYDSFRKTEGKLPEFFNVKKKQLHSSFWKQLKEQDKITKWKPIAKDFLGKQSSIFASMGALGVHKNEINLCKDTSKKEGDRRKLVFAKVGELLTLGTAKKD